MKMYATIIALVGLLSISPLTNAVQASDTRSFTISLLKVDVILQGLENYLESHHFSPGDSITYGKLIEAGNLPEQFCQKNVVNNVCGGKPIVEEYQHAAGPPMETMDTFAIVKIILPYREPGPEHLAQLKATVREYPCLVALLNHDKGKIPVVLYEVRDGALERFLLSVIFNRTPEPPTSTPARGYHL